MSPDAVIRDFGIFFLIIIVRRDDAAVIGYSRRYRLFVITV